MLPKMNFSNFVTLQTLINKGFYKKWSANALLQGVLVDTLSTIKIVRVNQHDVVSCYNHHIMKSDFCQLYSFKLF